MRIAFSLGVFAAFAVSGVARAQQPVDPYNGPVEVAQPQPVQPRDYPQQPINPYGQQQPGYGYPPPVYGYPPPVYGYPPPNVYAPPQPYQQPYYVYPAPPPPVYYSPAPPVVYRAQLRCSSAWCGQRPSRVWDGARRFSFGVSGTVLGLNQKIGNDNLVLGGAGFHFRFRSRGRFGLELMQSFLHADAWNGGFQRDSYPFQMSLMLYLMPNDDSHHFNIYGLAGFGLMFDTVKLFDKPSQDFVEWEGHLGLGAELRFKWFAIESDVRALGLVRDDTNAPASFYSGVAGAPIPGKSYGFSGNVYLSLWF